MKTYLNIVKNVLEHGKWKENRTGIRTLALPNQHFSHNMSEGFPLLTTRRMPFKSMTVELEGFIKGITSKKWYQERGCHFWDNWANPQIVNLKYQMESIVNTYTPKPKKQIQKDEDDLGAFYPHQWRRFGEIYDENDDGVFSGYDQFQYIVDTLKTNPDDRRMVCSAWNPNQLNIVALPACHMLWGITVINKELHLSFVMRSVDMGLGFGSNIASYALLLTLLSKESGFKPGNLSALLIDCHIYKNQIDGLKEQLTRQPKQLPSINIENWKGIFNWQYNDVILENYNPHNKISLGKIAV